MGGGGRRGSESILKIDGEPEIMGRGLTNQFKKVQIKRRRVDVKPTPTWRRNTPDVRVGSHFGAWSQVYRPVGSRPAFDLRAVTSPCLLWER